MPRKPAEALLAGVLLLGLGLRVFIALHDDGLYWPDEIYQTLEPAHRLVFGYGFVAQEFVRGSRSWALPGLLSLPLWLWKIAGGEHPRSMLLIVRLLFALLGVATAWASFRLARSLGARPLAAAAAAGLAALSAPFLYFGCRALSETTSALPVALGFALALNVGASRKARLAGASLLGLSVLLRLQNGVFCAALPLLLLARRERRAAAEALLTLCAWAVAFGLLDALTWGRPFHSAIAYLRFNLIEGRAAQWGVAPFTYYARVLRRCMPLPLLCLLCFVPLSARRAAGMLACALFFALVLSLVPHKELRFLLPSLPLFCALCAVGIEEAAGAGAATPFVAFVLAAVLAGTVRVPALRFADLGQYEAVKPRASAWDDFGSVNRLLLAAHGRADLCGLKMEGVDLVWSGGYSYLHRDVPLYPHDTGPSRASGHFNYALGLLGETQGEVVAAEGPWILVRTASRCVPDRRFSPFLR